MHLLYAAHHDHIMVYILSFPIWHIFIMNNNHPVNLQGQQGDQAVSIAASLSDGRLG